MAPRILIALALICGAFLIVFWGGPLTFAFKTLVGLRPTEDVVANLMRENAALRAELESYSALKEAVLHFAPGELPAVLYSKYPWNDKQTVTIGVGSGEGVLKGQAVEAGGFLLGIVKETFPHTSVVTTIFDRNFEMPVKIGADRVDGLFKGGANPEVTLIPKAKEVVKGDSVYSASAEVPFGMPLGTLGGTTSVEGEIWEAALLEVPYDFANIPTVQVIQDFTHETF